jgi:hypothetical protein
MDGAQAFLVWLTKTVGNRTYIGNGKTAMEENNDFTTREIVKDLATSLDKVMTMCGSRPESIALQNVKPGIMVDERFTSLHGDDDRGCMELKVHAIWGRAWMVYWRGGVDGVQRFFNRNCNQLLWEGKSTLFQSGWIGNESLLLVSTWERTKICFALTCLSVSLRRSTTPQEEVLTSSPPCDMLFLKQKSTPIRGTERVFDEGGRLWLAGYRIGNYKTIPDSEVPSAFMSS